MSEVSTNAMRVALRSLTHGVYVLSVRDGDRDDYLVVSLAMQCSVEPPRIAFALAHDARLLHALRSAGGGALSVLDHLQIAAVRRYGAPGGVKHLPVQPFRSAAQHPIPPEASHWLGFKLIHEMPVGDHTMFVAEVCAGGPSHAIIHADATANAGKHAGAVASEDATAAASEDGIAAAATHFAARPPLTLAASGFPYAG